MINFTIKHTGKKKGMGLTIESTLEQLNDTETVLEQIGDYMVGSVRRNLDEGGRPEKWRANIFGSITLTKTYESYNKVNRKVVSDSSVEISSGGGNAAFHHTAHFTKNSLAAKKFFWRMFYQTDLEMWKSMALSKKSVFYFPKRRYMMFQEPEDVNEIKSIIEKYIFTPKI